MNLVLVSRQNIDQLQELAIQNFSEVVDKDVQLPGFGNEVCFDETNLATIYKVVPNKDIKKLDICWILPYSKHMWQKKPGSYLSHVFGHEGPNSLLSYLIQEGLATGLTSSNGNRLNSMDMFSVVINLT